MFSESFKPLQLLHFELRTKGNQFNQKTLFTKFSHFFFSFSHVIVKKFQKISECIVYVQFYNTSISSGRKCVHKQIKN